MKQKREQQKITHRVEILTGYHDEYGRDISYIYIPKTSAKNNVKWLKEKRRNA